MIKAFKPVLEYKIHFTIQTQTTQQKGTYKINFGIALVLNNILKARTSSFQISTLYYLITY